MNVRLPRGVVHSDPGCYHVAGKAVSAPLLPPAPGEVCRHCRQRELQRIAADRAARVQAVREQARRDVIERPEQVIEWLVQRGRTG